jgi:PAS domain S-box-containing protein
MESTDNMATFGMDKFPIGEKNLKHILDNLKDGIIAHDLNRHIFFFNRAAERITGYRREDVIGKDCHEVMGSPFCGEHCSFCNDEPGFKDQKEYPLNILTKNGETRHVEMTATMMKDEHGQNFGVLACFRDLTELMRLQIRADELKNFDNIIGQDSQMITIFQQIRDMAEYDFPVHIYGETGTGKELIANAIHNESRRAGAPFVPINCGALPEGLIESELFGHVKGAFSGAIRDKKGRFELSDGGTVFLDEVAELSKPLQVKLLRFLQEGTFEKVGGEKTILVNIRVISATNKNLKKLVDKNHFREDLFYRLNVIPIHIPPLRDRKNDIPLLVQHSLQQITEQTGKSNLKISNRALSTMMSYHWPGNVRELQNAVQFSFVKSKGTIIQPEDLPLELTNLEKRTSKRGPARKLSEESVHKALVKSGGNKAKAARILGVGRATLYRFLSEHTHLMKLD